MVLIVLTVGFLRPGEAGGTFWDVGSLDLFLGSWYPLWNFTRLLSTR